MGQPASGRLWPRGSAFSTAVLVAMWNYMGWDNASTVAQEVENPQRNYPRAMIAATFLTAVTYILPLAAMALAGLSPTAFHRRLDHAAARSAARCWGWPWLPAAPSPASACSTRW
jgi:amino acid transporter